MSVVYESQRYIDEYLLFHFGRPEQILKWPGGPREALDFPVRTVSHFSASFVDRSLDVGCAVGRSAFELSRHSREVVGIDFSQAFIESAKRISREKCLKVRCLEEGACYREEEVELPEGVNVDGVTFEVGDAMNLREDLGLFDRVHAANLVCRLPEPQRFLERLARLVRPGGELVLATPCTWLEEFTKQENWPSGQTLKWLQNHLSSQFELKDVVDEPFLIRESSRKFQWTVSMVTRWERKEPALGGEVS